MLPDEFMETIGWTMLFYALGCLIGMFMDPGWQPLQDAVIPMSRGTAITGCVVVIAALVGLAMASWSADRRTPEVETSEVETPDIDLLYGVGTALRREWELFKDDLAMEMGRQRRARFPASAQAEALELERETRLDILRDCPDISLGRPLSPMERDDGSQEESVGSETSGDEWRRRLISVPDYDESAYSPEELSSDEEFWFEELLAEEILTETGVPGPPPTEVHGLVPLVEVPGWGWVPGDEVYDVHHNDASSQAPSSSPLPRAIVREEGHMDVFISPLAEEGPASPEDVSFGNGHEIANEERAQLFISPNGEELVVPEGVMLFNVEEPPKVGIDEWLASLEEHAPAPLVPEPWLPYVDIVEEERRRWMVSPHDSHAAAFIDEQESNLEDVALLFEIAEEMTSGEGKEVVSPDPGELDPILQMAANKRLEQFERTKVRGGGGKKGGDRFVTGPF